MSEHLTTRCFLCKEFVNSNPCIKGDSKPALIAGPCATIQGTDDDTSVTNWFPGINNFQPCPQHYESQIHSLTQLVGMDDGCQPTKVPMCLEPDNLVLNMAVFPFATMLPSLLNCSILNKLENLVVNPHDRFGRFESCQGCTGSMDSTQKKCLFPKILLGVSLHL